jgi:hypothetical protein
MKRVLTGVNGQGRSYIVCVEEIDPSPPAGQVVWEYRPSEALQWIRDIDPESVAATLEPEELGGARWFFANVAPDITPEDLATPNMDDEGFHTTRTIDLNYIVDGELVLVLDEERITVQKGDFIVQQATRHAWHNESGKPVVFLGVLLRPPDA